MYNRACLSLVLTCDSHPEQYDVLLNGQIIAYIRLRYSSLTVECPDVGGEIIMHKFVQGGGEFLASERMPIMAAVLNAIMEHIRKPK